MSNNKRNRLKRLMARILIVTMLFSMMPISTALADDVTEEPTTPVVTPAEETPAETPAEPSEDPEEPEDPEPSDAPDPEEEKDPTPVEDDDDEDDTDPQPVTFTATVDYTGVKGTVKAVYVDDQKVEKADSYQLEITKDGENETPHTIYVISGTSDPVAYYTASATTVTSTATAAVLTSVEVSTEESTTGSLDAENDIFTANADKTITASAADLVEDAMFEPAGTLYAVAPDADNNSEIVDVDTVTGAVTFRKPGSAKVTYYYLDTANKTVKGYTVTAKVVPVDITADDITFAVSGEKLWKADQELTLSFTSATKANFSTLVADTDITVTTDADSHFELDGTTYKTVGKYTVGSEKQTFAANIEIDNAFYTTADPVAVSCDRPLNDNLKIEFDADATDDKGQTAVVCFTVSDPDFEGTWGTDNTVTVQAAGKELTAVDETEDNTATTHSYKITVTGTNSYVAYAANTITVTYTNNNGDTLSAVYGGEVISDTEKPVVTFDYTADKGPNPVDGTDYYGSAVTVKVTVTDKSACAATYKLNDGEAQTLALTDGVGEIVVDSEGTATISVTAVDAYTNSTTEATKTFVVDTKAPTVTVNGVEINSDTEAATTYYNTESVQIPVSVEDTNLNDDSVVVKIDGTAATVTDGMVTVSGEGEHTITVYAEDYAANSIDTGALLAEQKFVIDLTAPAISTGTEESYYAEISKEVEITVADSYLATSRVTVSKNGDEAVNVTEDETSTNGKHTYTVALTSKEGAEDTFVITVNGKDLAGNPAEETTYTYYLDNKAPEVEIATELNQDTDGNYYYKQESLTLEVTVTDKFIDISKYKLKIQQITDAGEESEVPGSCVDVTGPVDDTYTYTVTLPADAVYNINGFTVTDKAGTDSNTLTLKNLVIDNTDAAITAEYTAPVTNVVLNGIMHWFWNPDTQPLSVTLTATDNLFGVDYISYEFDDQNYIVYSDSENAEETDRGTYSFYSKETYTFDVEDDVTSTITYAVTEAHSGNDGTATDPEKDPKVKAGKDNLVVDGTNPDISFFAPKAVYTAADGHTRYYDQNTIQVKYTVTEEYLDEANSVPTVTWEGDKGSYTYKWKDNVCTITLTGTGETKFTIAPFTVVDYSDNDNTYADTETIVLDTVAPEVKIKTNLNKAEDGNYYYKQDMLTLEVTVTDKFIDLSETTLGIQQILDDGTENLISVPGYDDSTISGPDTNDTYTYTVTIPANAVYNINGFTVTDFAGHDSEALNLKNLVIDNESATMKVEYSEPVTSTTIKGILYWFWNPETKPLSVTLTAEDNLFGVDSFTYTFDGTETTLNKDTEGVDTTTEKRGSYSFNSKETYTFGINTDNYTKVVTSTAEYTVTEAHINTAGEVTDPKQGETLVVDGTDPVITFSVDDPVYTAEDGTRYYAQDTLTVKYTVTEEYLDEANSKPTVTWEGDEGSYTYEWKDNVCTITMTGTGETKFTIAPFTVTDYSGNTATWNNTEVFVLDTVAPVVTITPDWDTHHYTVQTIDSYYNNSEAKYVTATVTVTEKFFEPELFTIETGADSKFTYSDEYTADTSASKWTNNGDVHTCKINLNNPNADYKFAAEMTDRAGHDVKAESSRMVRDIEDPIVSFTIDPSGEYNKIAVTGSISVTEKNLRDDKGYDGLGSYTHESNDIDGGATSYPSISPTSSWEGDFGSVHTTSVTFSDDANYTYGNIQITDLAGNTGTSTSQSFCVDQTDPTNLSITYSQDVMGTILSSVLPGVIYYDAPVTVTLHAEDITSGVDTMEYTCTLMDGVSGVNQAVGPETVTIDASTSSSEYSFELPAEMLNDENQFDGKVSFSVTDHAGNSSSLDSTDQPEVIVDNIAPNITVTYSSEPTDDSDDDTYYYNQNFSAKITVNEANFDNEDIDVSVTKDGEAYTGFNTDFTDVSVDEHVLTLAFESDGEYQFTVDYTDHSTNDMEGDDTRDGEFPSPLLVLDTNVPVITVTKRGAEDGKADPDHTAYDDADEINIDISVDDDHINENDVTVTLGAYLPNGESNDVSSYTLQNVSDFINGISTNEDNTSVSDSLSIPADAKDAVYVLEINAKDSCGNAAEANTSIMFSVNRNGSTYYLGNPTETLNDKVWTNADYWEDENSKNETAVEIHEISVEKLDTKEVSVVRDASTAQLSENEQFTVIDQTGAGDNWNDYQYIVNNSNFEEEGSYSVETVSTTTSIKEKGTATTNSSGNSDSATVQFVVDMTVPNANVSGIVDGEYYPVEDQPITITLSDNYALSDATVFVNGEAIATADAADFVDNTMTCSIHEANDLSDLVVTVQANDKAGNSYTTDGIQVRINKNPLILYAKFFIAGGILLLALIGVLFGVIYSRKKKAKEAQQ